MENQEKEQARLAKNLKIKENGKKTRDRRAQMLVKTRDLKIVHDSLSKTQKQALKRSFQEAKWLRNAALAANRDDLDYLKELNGEVPVKIPDGKTEQRKFEYLGSQIKQSVLKELKSNKKTLKTRKERGYKVGPLKFVRNVKSIDLQQYGVTYRFHKETRKKIKVQGIPGFMRIRGYEQLQAEGLEFANAKLVHRADGYHLIVTTYQPRNTDNNAPTSKIGVDMGVKIGISLSNGEEIDHQVTDKLEKMRKLRKKLSRQVKDSNGYLRTLNQIKREYQKISDKKDDIANQLVSRLTADSVVFFQDESLSSWKSKKSKANGSKKLHHGVLGRVKTRLKRSDNAVMLPRWVATTAWCGECGSLTKHSLDKRVFTCVSCGFSELRDVHAARNMIILGEKYLSLNPSGTEGLTGGDAVRLKGELYRVEPVRASVKPDTA